MGKTQRFLVLKQVVLYAINFIVKETCTQPVTNKFKNDTGWSTKNRPAVSPNSPNWHRWVASRVWQYAAACTKVHWRTRRPFSAPSL